MRRVLHVLNTAPGPASIPPGLAVLFRLLLVLAFPVFGLLGLGGCSGGRVIPLDGPQPTYPYHALEAHSKYWLLADSLWELRADPESARRSLKAYRTAAKRQKKVPELRARLSHACYFVAAYLETSADKKDGLFREGQNAAEAGMLLHPGYAAKFRETGDETEAVRELDSAYVEVLYWYVINLGRELSQESVIIRRGNKDRVEALNDRLLQLDPGFCYAGPHRIAGAIPARLPEGNLEDAKAHFEKAVALAPGYLGNRVAYADFYAIRTGDRALFLEQLTLVTAAKADSIQEIAPENRYAQEQAKLLLAKS